MRPLISFLTSFGLAAALISNALSREDEGKARDVQVILVGDSTVAPKSGWGDAFAKLFAKGVRCENMALGGRSSKSYRDEGHWKRVIEAKPQWILIQFGHNDQPGKGPKRETDAKTTFRKNLAQYVSEAQTIGAKPVLITSLTRRNFTPTGRFRQGTRSPPPTTRAQGTRTS